MKRIQVMLRFPEGHWIEKIPKGTRAKLIMEILDMNSKHNDLKEMQHEINEIKSLLLNQQLPVQETISKPKGDRIEQGDNALIESILKFGGQKDGHVKTNN